MLSQVEHPRTLWGSHDRRLASACFARSTLDVRFLNMAENALPISQCTDTGAHREQFSVASIIFRFEDSLPITAIREPNRFFVWSIKASRGYGMNLDSIVHQSMWYKLKVILAYCTFHGTLKT